MTSLHRFSRHAIATALATSVAMVCLHAAAQTAQFDIPAQPLADALRQFAAQSGVQLVFAPDLAARKTSQPVRGTQEAQAALQQLLQGSGLESRREGATWTLAPVAASGASLQEVRVTAQAERSGTSEGSGSYAATGPVTLGTGLGLTQRETPQSVSVMTRQRIDDEGLTGVAQVLEKTPGIQIQHIGASRFGIVSRGYTIDNYQLDGIVTATDIVSQNIPQNQADMVIYDRVEVLRGAAGLMVGAGDPSGTINLVRKRPTRQFQAHVAGGVGSWSRGRAEVDVAGPLNASGSVRGRLVAAHEQGGTHVDHYRQEKSVLYGILEADLSPTTLLTVGLDHQRSDPRGQSATGLPLFYNSGVQTNFGPRANAAAHWNTNKIDATNVFARVEQKLAADWSLQLAANVMDGKRRVSSADASWGFPNPAVGNVQLYGGTADARQKQKGFDVQLKGPFQLAGRQHEAMFGFNWSQFENLHDSWTDDVEGRTVNLNTWGNQTALPTLSGAKFMDYDSWQRQSGVYGALRLKPRDDLAVILGLRRSSYSYQLDAIYPSRPASSNITVQRERGVVTPYAGIVYDINDQHSVYASYTNVFKPQAVRDRSGAVLDPREGDNYEIGLKSSLLGGRLTSAVALYEIRQDNLAERDPGQTVPGTRNQAAYLAVQGAKTQGLDLELTGELVRDWQVGASYNWNQTKDAKDERIRTVFPRQMVKLWTTYRLPGAWSGLTLGGGIHWQDRIHYTTTPWQLGKPVTGEQPAYAVVNLMARYTFNRQWSATLNIYNVFNKHYLQGLDSTFHTGYYGPTRNATLQVKYQF